MTIPPKYLGPYIGSNIVAIGLLVVAAKWPKVARALFILIFLAACIVNAFTVLTQPEAYLMYGETAVVQAYRDFIYGPFSQYTAAFVLAIAIGQLAVAALLVGKGILLRLGVIGGIIFLTAIAPLGVGSAFPFSLFAIAALLVMYRKLSRQKAGAPLDST
jgi:hypothetical protein